jgi:putative membrane protein insertion efficiency factor
MLRLPSLPPPGLWPRRLLALPVRAYRLLLSPSLGSACRFVPSCSVYALEALDQHGARRGSALTLWRLARCHPWCDGGLDPVPPQAGSPGLFTRLVDAAPGQHAAPADLSASSASSLVPTGKKSPS